MLYTPAKRVIGLRDLVIPSGRWAAFSNRLNCLDYPSALPICSGMIESGHRHVLQARLKKAGTAWLREHADQIAHLRGLRANRQWESLWN